jgi:putative Mn2+ efflux pump MntP
MTIVEIIQSMLAPGIMISACGLLLLGMNNKYSLVVNRIRVLDEEKRKLKQHAEEGTINQFQERRLNNITIQIRKLAYRIKLVRNAVIFYSNAVAFFILTCLMIGLSFILGKNVSGFVTVLFLIGMLSVFTGILYACLEVIKGYQIVQIEIKET